MLPHRKEAVLLKNHSVKMLTPFIHGGLRYVLRAKMAMTNVKMTSFCPSRLLHTTPTKTPLKTLCINNLTIKNTIIQTTPQHPQHGATLPMRGQKHPKTLPHLQTSSPPNMTTPNTTPTAHPTPQRAVHP